MLKKNHLFAFGAIVLILGGICMLWVASLRIPALEDITERKLTQSTKIYDRTGEILLFDMAKDTRRAFVPFEDISYYAKAAVIAIEDQEFYTHKGFDFSSFLRAVLVNLTTLSFSQGGSTITQQVVKNSILTKDKSPARKLKELILALKLEQVVSKEEILSLYLNEIPYGGTIYGIEEAAQSFFAKPARELTLAESAYLAAVLKAPTYYSPYGSHRDALEARKNLVLQEMLESELITKEELADAVNEEVVFQPRQNTGGIKAPHFVFFVIDQLIEKYGESTLINDGFKVITTLDYGIQQDTEAVARKYGPITKQTFNGENNAIVVIDPKTGDILAMSGSRNYFDTEIDGNFNVATGFRQPGSTFKPFVYSVLFNKGYTHNTVLFDIPIQFSPNCAPNDFTTHDICYAPVNYDDRYRGPMTIRDALAQSVNLPAVQALYLAGVRDSVALAQNMGIQSLNDISSYGLSLVLGGGSVSLLDMTSAYGVFANDGVRNPYNAIARVEDLDGNLVDSYTPSPRRVLNEETARTISDILSDNAARAPAYGFNSPLYVASRDVAVKTGTSNDFRDAWIIGYSPNVVIGAWVGNNDNSPMEKKAAGLIVSPIWRELMDKTLPKFTAESFIEPVLNTPLAIDKPVLRGEVGSEVHSILHWVDKNDPKGPVPSNPSQDPQYNNWEYAVSLWANSNTLAR